MEQSKIIKIIIVGVIGILAIVYYFFNHKETTTYENILTGNVVVENETKEEKIAEEKTSIKVYVVGEVNNPGVVELEEGARIQDAIESAGGIKAEANLKNVNLAYEVSDGEKIYIPNLNETGEEENNSTINDSNGKSNGKININKATAAELTTIPGIGASTADKIIAYREKNGKFKAIEDIKKVSGIGDSKYENIREYLSVK